MNIGQEKRLTDFFDKEGNSLIVDLSNGLFGVEFRNTSKKMEEIFANNIDGVILSPGEAKRHYDKFKSKSCPALIVRCDWSNYLLDSHSLYPAQKFRHVAIASASEALRIGASAVIMDLFYGVDDKDNVENIQMLRQLCEEGLDNGIPTIANIIPFGPRVNSNNYNDIILLGMRIALELGATGASIPIPHSHGGIPIVESSLKCPLFINPYQSPFEPILPQDFLLTLKSIRELGIKGLILDGFNPIVPINNVHSFMYP